MGVTFKRKVPNEVQQLFEGRSNFAVIGLTGRTGSGCTTAANILACDPKFPTHHDARAYGEPLYKGLSAKRYNILKKYSEENWDNFISIKVSDLISAYLLKLSREDLINFIIEAGEGKVDKEKIEAVIDRPGGAYKRVIDKFNDYYHYSEHVVGQNFELTGEYKSGKGIRHYMVLVRTFTSEFKKELIDAHSALYILTYQCAGNSIRRTGKVMCNHEGEAFKPEMVFHLPESINRIIKVIKRSRRKTFIVVDAIRNPHEARFFKDRYSAFYLVSINAPDADRFEYLTSHHKFTAEQIDDIDKTESGDWLKDSSLSNTKSDEEKRCEKERSWISQNVKKCIEMSDIHLFNPRNELPNNNVLKAQIAWYVSLIKHPGLVSPTPMERVMQIAYTAKANSGCISRQVGAVITNQDQSVKAIGWNDVAEGQYPCSLRSVDGVLHEFDPEIYSEFERNDSDFRGYLEDTHKKVLDDPGMLLGRNCSYCFKDAKNKVDKKGNQVHTRSLHAEENAFLQITKYGGQSIQGGKLYTTASPCELCAKKAYQLGIKEIIFIDPYPGIAKEHILAIGKFPPKMTQFRGAVGKAYHMLYEPVIPYKDELEYFIER